MKNSQRTTWQLCFSSSLAIPSLNPFWLAKLLGNKISRDLINEINDISKVVKVSEIELIQNSQLSAHPENFVIFEKSIHWKFFSNKTKLIVAKTALFKFRFLNNIIPNWLLKMALWPSCAKKYCFSGQG